MTLRENTWETETHSELVERIAFEKHSKPLGSLEHEEIGGMQRKRHDVKALKWLLTSQGSKGEAYRT